MSITVFSYTKAAAGRAVNKKTATKKTAEKKVTEKKTAEKKVAAVKETEKTEYKRLMTSNEAGILGKLMKNVVENGTASALNGRGYTVAGKTGSA